MRTAVAERSVAVWEGLEEMRDALRAFLVRQSSDENEIEDVIQETFLRAARYRRAHNVQSLRPWAMRIALNVLADARRRVPRTQVLGELDESNVPATAANPSPADRAYRVGGAWLDGEAACALLGRALRELSVADRQLLGSFYGGGCTTRRTALECGIPRHLVKVRLYRARQRLQRALEARIGADEGPTAERRRQAS